MSYVNAMLNIFIPPRIQSSLQGFLFSPREQVNFSGKWKALRAESLMEKVANFLKAQNSDLCFMLLSWQSTSSIIMYPF